MVILSIPPHATQKLQPLDAFLNLHLMQFVHYGYAIIKLEEETTDNLGKLSCDALMKNAGIWPVNANIIPESKLIAYNNELFTSSNATLRSHNNVALDNSCVPGCNITVNDTIVLDVSFKDIVPIPKLKPTKRNTEESENITSFPYKIRIEESI